MDIIHIQFHLLQEHYNAQHDLRSTKITQETLETHNTSKNLVACLSSLDFLGSVGILDIMSIKY